eukprot:m.62412 g.62412  ORF g.62412 m.62412 type:complete len:192 (+) comp35067_c0_seq1:268-843(+)
MCKDESLYLFMSPKWLAGQAEFFQSPSKITETSLLFAEGTKSTKLFRTKIYAPGQISDNKMNTAQLRFHKEDVTGDTDIFVALCDNENCLGFWFLDQNHIYAAAWPTTAPMCKSEKLLSTLLVASNRWEIRFELTPSGTSSYAWTSNGEVVNHYSQTLKPANGLWLTVCRDDSNEKYNFHFFEVSVRVNSF